MIHKLQSLKVEKMGQILCVKKVPFCKSGHIFGLCVYLLLFTEDETETSRLLWTTPVVYDEMHRQIM